MRLVITLAVFATIAWTATTSLAADITLRFNLWVPPTHHTHTRMMVPWSKEVERVTEGRVKVQFTSSSLGSPPRQFDLAAQGIADVTFGDHAYSPGRFFATKTVELPFMGNSAEALSVAHWRVYSSLPVAKEEHRGVKLLSTFTNGPIGLMLTKVQVNSLDAMHGLKIRVPGSVSSRIIKLMGGTPIGGTVSQVFELFSQGVIDGSGFAMDAYKNFRLGRFVNYVTTVPDGLYNVSFFLVMNRKSWDRIPPPDQKAIMEVSGETFARRVGRVWDEEDRGSIALMKKNNVTITRMGGEFLQKTKELLKPLREEWVKKANEKGLDGNSILSRLAIEYEKELKAIQNR